MRSLLCGIAVFFLAMQAVGAQSDEPPKLFRWGLMGGMGLSDTRLSGSAGATILQEREKARAAAQAAFFAELRLSRRGALRMGFGWTRGGYDLVRKKRAWFGEPYETIAYYSLAESWDYFQAPLALRWDFLQRGRSRIYGLGGAYTAFHARSARISTVWDERGKKSRVAESTSRDYHASLWGVTLGLGYAYRLPSGWDLFAQPVLDAAMSSSTVNEPVPVTRRPYYLGLLIGLGF